MAFPANRIASILVLLSVVAASIVPFTVSPSVAQEGTTMKNTATEASAKRAKPRGRLPNYFNRVVSEDQRLQVYEIQQDYAARIAELEAQIEDLKTTMDQEVEDVLTDVQFAKVQKLRAEARARRTKAKSAK